MNQTDAGAAVEAPALGGPAEAERGAQAGQHDTRGGILGPLRVGDGHHARCIDGGALNGEVLRGPQRGPDAERRGHELAPTHDLAGGRFVGGEQHAGREVDPQARMQLKAALRGRAARPQAQGAAERQRSEAGMPQPSHPPSWPHKTRSAPRVRSYTYRTRPKKLLSLVLPLSAYVSELTL